MKTNKGPSPTFIITLSLLGIGFAALGYHYLRGKKKVAPISYDPDYPPVPTPKTMPLRGDRFPLHRGSKGPRVLRIQQALVQKLGSAILPKYGADGIWGEELENTLKSLKWPTRITEKAYKSYFSSLDGSPNMLYATRRAQIWKDDFALEIPEGIPLGWEIETRGGITLFENGNAERYFIHAEDTR